MCEERLAKKADKLAFYDKFLAIYMQVTKAWVRKSIRRPLIVMIKDKDLDIELSTSEDKLDDVFVGKDEEREKRIMLTRVRVKGIL